MKNFVEIKKSCTFVPETTYYGNNPTEHHLGIYGESQPKGGQLYSCNSGFTPTGAVVFVNFFSMKPEKFCSKGNDYPRTSTYAENIGYKSLTLLNHLFNKAPP